MSIVATPPDPDTVVGPTNGTPATGGQQPNNINPTSGEFDATAATNTQSSDDDDIEQCKSCGITELDCRRTVFS